MNARIRNAATSLALGLLAPAALLLGTTPSLAAEEGEGDTPSSREILQQMSETLKAAQRISFHAEVTFDDTPAPGFLIQLAGATEVALRRPDGFRIDYRDDVSAQRVWYDGKTLTLLDWAEGLYAAAAAPPTVDEAIDQFEGKYGLALPLDMLLVGDPYEWMLARAARGTYVGVHDVEGIPCHHLAFARDDLEWEIWIDQGKVPVPRKLLIRYKQEPYSPQYVAVLMDWNLAAKLPPATFEPEIPDGAVAVDFLKIKEEQQ
jgi:hypothetical protein